MTNSAQSRLLAFYSGESPDDRGRKLANILKWNDDELENIHDFIQWMFPLRERSGANPQAPVLDESTVEQFHSRGDLQEKLRASLRRMLKFYGLELKTEGPLAVVEGQNFASRSATWLTTGNHNHLRITRMIKSLKTLGLGNEADALFACLRVIYQRQSARSTSPISARTFQFWQDAASAGR